MGDALSCCVKSSNEDICILMIKRIKSSKKKKNKKQWKRQVCGGVESHFFDSSFISADSTLVFRCVRLRSVAVKN